jgi:hypothetical protein
MMAITESRQLIDSFAEYLESLRAYAKRVLLRGESLTRGEELDKKARMDLLFAIGQGFRLTENEILALIFKGVLRGPRRCSCPNCRARRGSAGV